MKRIRTIFWGLVGAGFVVYSVLFFSSLFMNEKRWDVLMSAIPNWLQILGVLVLLFYGCIEMIFWFTGWPDISTTNHPE